MLNPCCPASSEVTVIDTPDHTVLIVDGVQTLLPKYEDCAGAPLPGGTQLATCVDLATKQTDIQMLDEGLALGGPGDATAINFVGTGVTTSLAAGVLTVTVAGNESDTDVSAINVDAVPQTDGSLQMNVTVTEDATVVTDSALVPFWTETSTGLVEKINLTEASQDYNLMAGNGVTSAAVVGVAGLDDERGMTDRKTYAHIENNWVITTDRAYRVGVDARWPTVASVYDYLANRRFAAGTTQYVILPAGVTDASAGLGPMHPQHEQISISGAVTASPLPTRSSFVLTGITNAAIDADYAVNSAILEAKFPSILNVGSVVMSNGQAGYGKLESLTVRGNLNYTGDGSRTQALVNVAIEGSLSVVSGSLGTQNLYLISPSTTGLYKLYVSNSGNYQGLGVQYIQGGVNNITITSNSSGYFSNSEVTFRGAQENNIAVLTNSNLAFETCNVLSSKSGDVNVAVKGSSDIVLYGTTNEQFTVSEGGLTPGKISINLYVSDNSSFVLDLNNPFTRVNLATAQIGALAVRGSVLSMQEGALTNHVLAHIQASQSDVTLSPLVASAAVVTMDATPTNSIISEDGSRVKINNVVLGQPSVPTVGTQGATFGHIVV